MDRPTILRDLAAEALSPGARDVSLRELDNIIKPISTRANVLNGCRIGIQAGLLIFVMTLATAYILEPSKTGDPGSWWPIAAAVGLIFAVNIEVVSENWTGC
jgi:hypothetical protein